MKRTVKSKKNREVESTSLQGGSQDLLNTISRNHGKSGLGTFVGRVATMAQESGLTIPEVMDTFDALLKSESGRKQIHTLVKGAYKYAKQTKGNNYENN